MFLLLTITLWGLWAVAFGIVLIAVSNFICDIWSKYFSRFHRRFTDREIICSLSRRQQAERPTFDTPIFDLEKVARANK